MARRWGSTTRRWRKYRWWQWLLRGGAVAGLLAIGLYAALPLWLPTGWVARRLAADLSVQFGTAVSVGEVSVGWSDGIRIASISLADPTGASDLPLITTGMIRADFSPLRLALTRRIEWIEIEAPQIRLAVDDEGRWNIAALRAPPPGVWIERINIRRGVVRLDAGDEADPLQLEIADLQCRAGRRSPIGSVSGSAALVHGSRRAPVGLSITVDYSPAGDARPVLKCSFSGLDLAQLGLIRRLGLPLAQIEGVCEGSLSLPVADGTISKATASVTVDGLVIQPTVGPPLPTIQSAGIQLAGDVDLATGQVHVRSLELRGPGIELVGEAQFHASLLEGVWLSGNMLSVTAAVNPRAVATLLRGADRPALDPYEVVGDVQLQIDYRRRGDEIEATVNVDATAAAVASADGVIKPAGQTLACSFSAQCQRRTWQFVVDRTELKLGGNRLIGRGALSNIRRFLIDWSGPDHQWSLHEVGEELANFDWYAEWEINELDSLRRLGALPQRVLAPVHLAGRLTGIGRLDHADGVRLRIDMACDDDAQLRVGDWFTKPEGAPLAAAADLTYDPQSRQMGESTVSLTCGDGQASVRFTDVALDAPADGRTGPMGRWVADIRGTAHVDQVEQLAACFGPAAELGRQLSGAASGEFAVEVNGDGLRVIGSIDATPLTIRAADVVGKSAGQPVHLTCTTLWPWPDGPITMVFDAVMPGSELIGQWIGEDRQWSAEARLVVSDAAWLAEQIPWLGHPDRPLRLAGAADLRVDLAQRDGVLSANADLSADDLAIDWRRGERRKRSGTPLRVRVAGTRYRDPETALRSIGLSGVRVALGGITVRAAGTLLEADRIEDVALDVTGQWSLSLNESVRALLPEVDRWADTYGLAGAAGGRWSLQGTERSLQVDGHIDVTDLAAAIDLGPMTIRKPVGVPGALTWAAAVRDRGASVTVSDWTGRLGPVRAMGDARLTLAAAGDGEADVSGRTHVRLWTSRPDQLAILLPDLAEWRLAGAAQLEGQLTYEAGRLDLPYVRVHLDDLSFMHRGRRVAFNGSATVSEIAPTDDGPWPVRLGRVHSDGLTVSAGDSAATVVVDLDGLPATGRGTVSVLAEHIDATDLRTWLVGSAQLPELTPQYTRRLIATVEAVVEGAKQWGAEADLTVTADIDLLRNFPDDKVRQVYDAHNVVLRAHLRGGQVDVQYTAGVNGGTLIDRVDTDLNAAEPQLHHVNTIREMMATENLQPQIAAFFPGNEVLGFMWREMDLRRPLVAALANAVDPRHPAPPEGWGKITLIDGITRGRAAPLYVTRLFPGLNLVEYPYERMVAFTDFYADGTAYNDMVFTGKTYNMYIEGATDAEQVARYDVGLILGRTRNNAEWHHRYKQGRLLLLQHKLKIVDGQKADEEVSFPWPNEAVFAIFVKNNYFYRLWLERQKDAANGSE